MLTAELLQEFDGGVVGVTLTVYPQYVRRRGPRGHTINLTHIHLRKNRKNIYIIINNLELLFTGHDAFVIYFLQYTYDVSLMFKQ